MKKIAISCLSLLLVAACSRSVPGPSSGGSRGGTSRADKPPSPLSEFCTGCPTHDEQRARLLEECKRARRGYYESSCGGYRALFHEGYPVERAWFFDASGALLGVRDSGSEHGPWREIYGNVPEACAGAHGDRELCPKP